MMRELRKRGRSESVSSDDSPKDALPKADKPHADAEVEGAKRMREATEVDLLLEAFESLTVAVASTQGDESYKAKASEIAVLISDIASCTENLAKIKKLYDQKAERIRRESDRECPFDSKMERDMGVMRRQLATFQERLESLLAAA